METSEREIQDRIWSNEQPRKIIGALDFCVKGVLHKETFFGKILKTPSSDEGDKIDIEELNEEARKLQEQDFSEKPIFETLPLLGELENREILTQKVVGKSDSYLTELIDKLDNFSWVKTGIKKYLDQTEHCPFCQQEIEDDLKVELKKIIDETFAEKEDEIQSIYKQYDLRTQQIEKLAKQYQLYEGFSNYKEVSTNADLLKERTESNLYKLNKKVENASLLIDLEPTTPLIQKLNTIVEEQNSENRSFNSRITSKKAYEEDINGRFWKALRQKYDERIKQFQHQKALQEKKLKDKKAEKRSLREKIQEEENVIRINRQKNTTVQKSIDYINAQLRYVGFEGFFIKKVDSKSYKLERPDDKSESLFHSLSEGEKTIITFLYFIQQCLGAELEDESPDLSKRIVVIDDPISSLSFPLVFDIAHALKSNFFNSETDFAQIFILTHHLYFYHELVERNGIHGDHKSYYRVTKNKYSRVLPLNKNEIKNSYQSYWYILRDIRDGNTTSFALPNTMRNILEHYFSFIGGDKNSWKDALSRLTELNEENQSYKTLNRYLNRESHSDPINLTDTNEFEVDKFIKCFRAVFDELDHLDHYKKMMDDVEPVHGN